MVETHDIVIVGGGPAGMVAGLLFARAGLKTLVIEKHGDFLRDFRGDTVHPSTLQIFHELGLLDALLARPHNRVEELSGRVAGETIKVVDFRHLPVVAPYIALMPQWEFLDFVADAARRYPCFALRMNAKVVGATEDGERVGGVMLDNGDAICARLVIACDGRDSTLRSGSGLPSTTIGAPMDVLWFRLPKSPTEHNDTLGVFEAGRLIVLIDRHDYWQCAFVVAKGSADAIRNEGIGRFCDRVRAVGPETRHADILESWDDVKLLTVTVDRLELWHKPGLLFIGDAAHAMSPIGGVGINLAVQDAVATANALAGPMAAGADPDPLLHKVQARRMLPTRVTQAIQRTIQDRVIAPLLTADAPLDHPPALARVIDRVAWLRRIPARILGLGIRPEHVHSPEAEALGG